MKFSDINENLTEAPEKFDAKQGLVKQAKTKIKKKLSPTKKGREQAQVEDDTKQQAKQIKSQFNKWMAKTGEAGARPSTESFIEFANQHMEELAPYIEDVAIKLNFHDKPEPKDIQKQVPTDDINYSVELDDKGAAKKDAAPEKAKEPTDPTKKPEGMEQEEYDSIKAAYAKKFGDDTDESVEEDADDAEPKVDTSASIYEARLRGFLLLEKEIKDNQLDTLIVRVIQTAAKGGASTGNRQPDQKPQQSSQKQSASTKEQPSKEDGWRQKISKVLTGTGNVSDIGTGSTGGTGDDSAPNIDPEDLKALTGLLATVAKGKAGPNEKKIANKLLTSLKNTYGE